VCVVENGSTVCEIVGYGRRIPVEIPAYGEHMVSAALEGAAVGFELGLTDAEIAHGIADYQSVGHRGRVLHHAGMTIIDDCYNANPTSVSAAIRSLMRLPGRKVCILGDMLELGEASEQLHAEIGQLCSKLGVELVLTCGDASRHICQGAGECAVHFGSREELIDALPRYLHAGDAVLVKASNSMGFDRVCQAIEEM
jgi:UDP-N-acetylmuramoyl-tripeptide--D-alanyl-D-alanine ligase